MLRVCIASVQNVERSLLLLVVSATDIQLRRIQLFSVRRIRSQQVKYLNLISTPKPINISIVQGSGIEPTLYIVMEGD